MITPTGVAMIGMWVVANVGFWVGYHAGKHRWRGEPEPLGPDEL